MSPEDRMLMTQPGTDDKAAGCHLPKVFKWANPQTPSAALAATGLGGEQSEEHSLTAWSFG